MQTTGWQQSIALLRSRRFGTFFFSSLLSNIGTWAQSVAQPWLLLSLGASPFLLGLDAFAMGAPIFALTLIGGLLADTRDRRRVIAGFQSLQMLCPILIIVLWEAHRLRPETIILLSLVVGITDALSMPSFQSIAPSIVQPDEVPTAIALNAVQFNLARIVGPAIAGVLMARVGAAGAFGVSALSYLPFILVALWILPSAGVRRAPAERLHWRRLTNTLRDITRQPRLRGALLTTLVTSVLLSPIVTFSPVLVKQVFHGTVSDFGTALTAFGIGGLAGAVGLAAVEARHDRQRISLVGAVLLAISVVVSALNTVAALAPIGFACAGVAMTVSHSAANTLLQSETPAPARGQSVALFMLCARGGGACGSLLSGWAVADWGVRSTLVANGLLALLAVVALQWTGRASAARLR